MAGRRFFRHKGNNLNQTGGQEKAELSNFWATLLSVGVE
jgi:hypothetical protein